MNLRRNFTEMQQGILAVIMKMNRPGAGREIGAQLMVMVVPLMVRDEVPAEVGVVPDAVEAMAAVEVKVVGGAPNRNPTFMGDITKLLNGAI